MTTSPDLTILEEIEHDPNATQASLAARLDVAVGTINWHIRRLIEKGYVKVKRAERHKLKYIITPEGIALRTRLTLDYISSSFQLYRLVRQRVIEAANELKSAGFTHVTILGTGDVAEICRLTCIEQGLEISKDDHMPRLEINGLKVIIHMEESR